MTEKGLLWLNWQEVEGQLLDVLQTVQTSRTPVVFYANGRPLVEVHPDASGFRLVRRSQNAASAACDTAIIQACGTLWPDPV